MSVKLIVLFLGVGLVVSSCSDQKKARVVEEVSLKGTAKLDVPEKLSDWKLFVPPIQNLQPEAEVLPYDLNSPLFSDYALKKRFIKLPKGVQAKYNSEEVFDFPKGTLLIKNFYYKSDLSVTDSKVQLIETRLLIHEDDGWNALTYVWNNEQTEATLEIAGKMVPVSWKNEEGLLKNVSYSVPNLVQCKSCHEKSGIMTPIGPSARQLNRIMPLQDKEQNQLVLWKQNGILDSVPEMSQIPKLAQWENTSSGSLDLRARAWLEINCAHCHRAEGPAKNTGLHLLASEKDPYRIGVGKPPIAAGRGSGGMKYGIVPGHPEQSIVLHRIASLDPGVMMPELGRKLQHEEGVELIREWIAEMNVE